MTVLFVIVGGWTGFMFGFVAALLLVAAVDGRRERDRARGAAGLRERARAHQDRLAWESAVRSFGLPAVEPHAW